MAWIESHQSLKDHPKTKRLVRALGISRAAVIGHLHMLWWYCLDYAQDGDLSHDRFTAEDIADMAEWEGDPLAFVDALVRAGFLESVTVTLPSRSDGDAQRNVVGARLVIHDWDDYAGKLLDQRSRNAERQQRYRARHGNAGKENGNVTVMSPSRNGATVPNLTVPNRTEPERDTHAPARIREELILLPDPFDVTDELAAWIREHSMTKKWVVNRLESFAETFGDGSTRMSMEDWYRRCRKFLLDDWNRDAKPVQAAR